MDACPSNLDTTSIGTTSRSRRVAQVCRQKCGSKSTLVRARSRTTRSYTAEYDSGRPTGPANRFTNTYCPDLAVIPSNGLVCWSAGWMCCGCQIKLAWLQAFEEGEELVWGLVAAGWHVRWCDSVQRLFLQLEVGVGVDLRGADVLVP